jgi:hypothetical protein
MADKQHADVPVERRTPTDSNLREQPEGVGVYLLNYFSPSVSDNQVVSDCCIVSPVDTSTGNRVH